MPKSYNIDKPKKHFTIQQIVKIAPKLNCQRQQALKAGEKIGMNVFFVDALRNMLGYNGIGHKRKTREEIDFAIQLVKDNPDKSVYQLFREYKDALPFSTYQYYYAMLRTHGIKHSQRRFEWSKFQVMRIVDCKDNKKMRWPDIARLIDCTIPQARCQYTKFKKKKNENPA